jgi:DNA-binding transcriptional regulator YbjK
LNVAVTFQDSISLGTLLVMLVLGVAGVIGLVYGGRYRIAYEAASAAAKELREALRDAHDRLDEALRELGDAKEVIQRYEQLPNMERIVTLMTEQAERQDNRFSARLEESERRADIRAGEAVKGVVASLEQHEIRADQRHAKTIGALAEITRHLEVLNDKAA